MEPEMLDIDKNWKGLLKMELGGILYVDFSDDNKFEVAMETLMKEILNRITLKWVLKKDSSLPVVSLYYYNSCIVD